MNKFKRICILTLSLMLILSTIAFGDEEVEYNRKEYDKMSEEIIINHMVENHGLADHKKP